MLLAADHGLIGHDLEWSWKVIWFSLCLLTNKLSFYSFYSKICSWKEVVDTWKISCEHLGLLSSLLLFLWYNKTVFLKYSIIQSFSKMWLSLLPLVSFGGVLLYPCLLLPQFYIQIYVPQMCLRHCCSVFVYFIYLKNIVFLYIYISDLGTFVFIG